MVLVALLVITQTFMRLEKQSIVVQIAMVLVYFKMSLMLDKFDLVRWTFVSFAFCSVMFYFACIDVLTYFGVNNVEFYQIKVMKDEPETKKQPVGALIFLSLQVAVLWLICGLFKN